MALTAAGARRQRTVHRAIRAMEDELLATLDVGGRAQLRAGLALPAGGGEPPAG